MIGTLLAVVGLGMGTIFMINPLSRWMSYGFNSMWPNQIPQEAQLIEAVHRNIISLDEYKDKMKQLGYDEKNSMLMLKNAERLLSGEELLMAKWRGFISEEEYKEKMKMLGYNESDISRFEAVRKYYPSPTDFIRFAVRDVFVPERVKRYGLDEDFPEDILVYAKKAGMDEDVLKWYWRAHWELPSPEQVIRFYNMFYPEILETELPDGRKYGEKYNKYVGDYKKIITDDKTVDEYLRMADISPFWRDRFKAATYPPITRVDLRRIYAMGLISDEELIARLMQLGYAKEDAELLAQFYKHYKNESGRELTRSQIVQAYNYRLITPEQAKEYLIELGYDKDEAQFIISLEDYKRSQKELEDKINLTKYLYAKGIIDEKELRDRLAKLELSAEFIDKVVIDADNERSKKLKLPTKTDILGWLKNKTITASDFVDLMNKLGYSPKWIEIYLKDAYNQELITEEELNEASNKLEKLKGGRAA